MIEAYYFNRSKMTLYAEGANLPRHTNVNYFGVRKYHFSTGRALLTNDRMFSMLPSDGRTIKR